MSSSFRQSIGDRQSKTTQPNYHRNQQYSIIGLTNAAGTLVERYSYSAYGTLSIDAPNGTVRTSSTYANRYTYTGREYDPDLNLYHFRARWYDPSAGGFISRDPLGYVDGMSLYRGYFGVKGNDPDGLVSLRSSGSKVVAQGRGPNGEVVSIYQDDVGCYVVENDLRVSVECPDPKSILMMREGETELQKPTAVAARDLHWAEKHGGFFFNDRYMFQDDDPFGIIEKINQEQLGGICNHKSYNCIAVLTVLTHGSQGDTFSGKVGYDIIPDFYGGMIYCRPCYIILNTCCTGSRGDNGQIYAAEVARVTGCSVFAPKHCLVGFFGTAYTKRYTSPDERIPANDPRNEILGRKADGCFKLFDPNGYCIYNPFGPKSE